MRGFGLTWGRTVDYHWSTSPMVHKIDCSEFGEVCEQPRKGLCLSTVVLFPYSVVNVPQKPAHHSLLGILMSCGAEPGFKKKEKKPHKGAENSERSYVVLLLPYQTLVRSLQAITHPILNILIISTPAKCQWINNGRREEGNTAVGLKNSSKKII